MSLPKYPKGPRPPELRRSAELSNPLFPIVVHNSHLHLLTSNALIPPTSPPPSATRRHDPRTLIHVRIVHRHTAQHCRAILMLPKHGARITPKVLTIRDAPSAIGIAALVSLGSLARSRTPTCRSFNKGVDAEKPRPLLDEALLVVVSVCVAATVTSAAYTGGWAGGGKRGWVEGGAGGGEGAVEGGGRVIVDAVHVFVRGHRARDLDELDKEEHGDPGKLKRGPDGS